MSSNNDIVAPLLVGGGILAAIAAAFLIPGRTGAKEPEEETQGIIGETLEYADYALAYTTNLFDSLGYGIYEAYNNFKELVLQYAPQFKERMDALGNSIQSFIENVLQVIPEACVTAVRYGIKIPYEFFRDFLGPIAVDVGRAIIDTLKLLGESIPPLSESMDELSKLFGELLGVPPEDSKK